MSVDTPVFTPAAGTDQLFAYIRNNGKTTWQETMEYWDDRSATVVLAEAADIIAAGRIALSWDEVSPGGGCHCMMTAIQTAARKLHYGRSVVHAAACRAEVVCAERWGEGPYGPRALPFYNDNHLSRWRWLAKRQARKILLTAAGSI